MYKNGISIILPCFNEAGNIKIIYSQLTIVLEKLCVDYEIIFVDDKSLDETIDEITSINNSRVKLLRNPHNLGLFKSWIEGVKESNFNVSCLIDADGQNPPQEIVRLYEKFIETGSDFVQGERSQIGRIKDNRYILSKGLNLILKIIFGDNGNDIKSGFILARTSALLDVLSNIPQNIKTGQTFVKLQILLSKYNLTTIETLFLNRITGESFIKRFPVKLITTALFDIFKYYLFYKKMNRYSFFEKFFILNKPLITARKFSLKEKILMNVFFFTFPIHKWAVSSNVKKLYLVLRESQYWDKQTLIRYQNLRLKNIFNHAYFNTKYYRKIFDQININPGNFTGIEDLEKLPSLTKKLVNDNLYFDLFSVYHDKKKMYKISTSGSTGTPFSLFVDHFQLEMRMATTMRAWENAGWRFGDRQVRLWHQTIGMSKTEILRERIDAFLSNRKFIPAFEINEDNIHDIKNTLEKYNPVIIDGYAECLTLIARYQKEKMNIPNLKAVISSAQMLTDDTRSIIEYIFGVKVIDKYGAREFSGIAYENGDGSGHIVMSESYLIFKRNIADNLKFIEITDLNNTCIPIINYQLGDVASSEYLNIKYDNPTAKFNGFPRLGPIEGRAQSVLKLNNGKLIPSAFFLHFMKDYDLYVKHFQFVQKLSDDILIKIVPTTGWSNNIGLSLIKELKIHLGEVAIDIELVSEIKLIRTGKRISVLREKDLQC